MKSQVPFSSSALHLLTIKCPDCMMMWFAPGVGHGDTYVCKECGLSFVVCNPPNQSSQPSAENDRPETIYNNW